MKKALGVLLCIGALALVAGLAPAEEEHQAWFDIENCTFCKNLGQEEGLLDNIKWETHMIENGAVTLTQVPAEWEEAFERAEKHMSEAAAKMGSGEPVHLCGFCQSYGKLMTSGVKMESFKSDVARVTLMTSTDEKVVQMIHEHAKKTIEEYENWIAEEAKG